MQPWGSYSLGWARNDAPLVQPMPTLHYASSSAPLHMRIDINSGSARAWSHAIIHVLYAIAPAAVLLVCSDVLVFCKPLFQLRIQQRDFRCLASTVTDNFCYTGLVTVSTKQRLKCERPDSRHEPNRACEFRPAPPARRLTPSTTQEMASQAQSSQKLQVFTREQVANVSASRQPVSRSS